MSEVFISYAHATARQARGAAAALRTLGYSVWLDDDLSAHRAFTAEIEAQLTAANAALVIWSADAARSHWVLSEANRAREAGKLVQLSIDGARLPMPFDQIQCADLSGWSGDGEHPAWSKVVAGIADLVGERASSAPVASAPLPLPSKPSIAVLPFANLSGDAEQDYFADGVVEEITTALSRIRSIFVIASDSMLGFRGKVIKPADVARQLGVRYVLEGSVRKAGERVRIAVRLVDATEGAQVWAERFEDDLGDIFSLQDKVALQVAGKIEPTIRETEIRHASGRSTDNLRSYDLFLRALALWRSATRDGVVAGLDLLHRAIDLEPDYAPALASAAWCHSWLFLIGSSAEEKSHHSRQAAELAHRALQASSDDPEVLAYAADALREIGGDRSASLGLLQQAIAQNPGYAFAWLLSGALRVMAGETTTGVQQLETSIRMDPMTTFRAIHLCWLGVARFQERQFDEAANLLGQATALGPHYFYSYAALAACSGYLGRRQAGLDALTQLRSLQSMTAEKLAPLFGAPEHQRMLLEGIALLDTPHR